MGYVLLFFSSADAVRTDRRDSPRGESVHAEPTGYRRAKPSEGSRLRVRLPSLLTQRASSGRQAPPRKKRRQSIAGTQLSARSLNDGSRISHSLGEVSDLP